MARTRRHNDLADSRRNVMLPSLELRRWLVVMRYAGGYWSLKCIGAGIVVIGFGLTDQRRDEARIVRESCFDWWHRSFIVAAGGILIAMGIAGLIW